MFENEFMDILGNIGMSGLEKNRSVLDETAIEAEIKAVIKEVREEDEAKVTMHITLLVDRLEYDKQQAYTAGISDGIRLCKWMKEI